MGSSDGLWLGQDNVGMGLIGGREVGLRQMGLIDVGWALGWRTRRRRGSATWGLGWLGPVTLRPAEAWVGDIEREREREARCELWGENDWERTTFIISIGPGIKIIFFCLALMNSAHLSIDVHSSNGVKKNRFSSTARACFLWLRS